MKKKFAITTALLIFITLLTLNKRIVDQNAIITQAEVDGTLKSEISREESGKADKTFYKDEDREKNAKDKDENEEKNIKDKDKETSKSKAGEDSEVGFIEKLKDKVKSFIDGEEEDYENKFKVSLVGDMSFDGHIRNNISEHGYDYPWEYVSEYFKDDHISIGNLETSITREGSPWPNKQFNFRSDPENVGAMKRAGMDVVSLANNHTLDYGYDGLKDTIDYLNAGDIKLVGAGEDTKEASKALIIEKEETKIGVLGYSRVAPDVGWWPTDDKAGVASAYDKHLDQVLENIEETKKEVDLLIIMVHWGKELHEMPREDEVRAAKKMIDMGADVIAGHHPHVLQGIEIYKGKPIFYSLGNFIFGSRSNLSGNTMIAQVNFNHKDIESIDIIPFHIKNSRPENISREKKEEKLEYLRNISSEFETRIDKEGRINISNGNN